MIVENEMAITPSKLLALLIAGGYIVAALVMAPNLGMGIMVALAVLFPLGLIWFPEFFGGTATHKKKTVLYTYDEPPRMRRPWRDSHPAIVSFMGWLFLVGLPVLAYCLSIWSR